MSAIPQLELHLGRYEARVSARLESWSTGSVARRLLERDRTLWFEDPVPEIENRLGWLDLPYAEESQIGDWLGFAAAERDLEIDRVVVLGMGGSSLAPELYQRTLGERRSFLSVLDSTHPDAVAALVAKLDLARTLFVVSSKSGSTIETLSLFHFFWHRACRQLPDPGLQFAVVTDSGSALETLAEQRRLHRIFTAPSDVGGRYSALSVFGLLPGALAGIDVRGLLSRARSVIESLKSGSGHDARQLLKLAAMLGELAVTGVDKLTLQASEGLAAFPDWLEQLVAESTGKQGIGILPVVGEELLPLEEYGEDRLFVGLLLAQECGGELDRHLGALADRDFPVVRIVLDEPLDIGFEIVRWEIAIALAGSILGINPFSQPDVQLAKTLARAAMTGDDRVQEALGRLKRVSLETARSSSWSEWIEAAAESSYGSVHAYLPPSEATTAHLARLQASLRRETGVVTTVGYGPRFLHSTGQLHKGGVAGASFLQITATPLVDLEIPGESVTFGGLISAQADGDAAALMERGHNVIRLELSEVRQTADFVQRMEENS